MRFDGKFASNFFLLASMLNVDDAPIEGGIMSTVRFYVNKIDF